MHYSKVLAAATAAAAATINDTTCNSIQIFLVRGHGEAIPGLQTSISDAICRSQASSSSSSSSCGFQSIAYNATSDAQTICQDQHDGIQMLRGNLTAYATACPRARLVVSGWSRGGALVTDLLAGGGGGLELTGTPALAPDEFPGPRVAAVVTFGELHHNAGMPWNVGNGSAADGQYPRTEAMLQSLSLWADRFRDYCVVDDPLCARGTDAAAHSSYFQSAYWPELVAKFVGSKL
ncbi:uncharacterized protein PG998_006825 [Apiospora kogelbergensis]|uniref:uncharacterized protein n=1 Tax=Apiospora kogelbergensis TaxID=1337665 RepID=UPI00313232DB